MNDTEYGLTAGVYTKDRARAEAILARVDAGSVYWNCCDRVSPRLPWTGPQTFGHRFDAVDGGHPRLRAAQGLAPARALTARHTGHRRDGATGGAVVVKTRFPPQQAQPARRRTGRAGADLGIGGGGDRRAVRARPVGVGRCRHAQSPGGGTLDRRARSDPPHGSLHLPASGRSVEQSRMARRSGVVRPVAARGGDGPPGRQARRCWSSPGGW